MQCGKVQLTKFYIVSLFVCFLLKLVGEIEIVKNIHTSWIPYTVNLASWFQVPINHGENILSCH